MFVTVHIERKDTDEPIVAEAMRRSIQQSLPDGTPVVVTVTTAETVGLGSSVVPDPNPPEPPEAVPPAQ